ncbi:MAG: pentapeptide repeat-containing protein, partial [Acidobacteriota bacterium]
MKRCKFSRLIIYSIFLLLFSSQTLEAARPQLTIISAEVDHNNKIVTIHCLNLVYIDDANTAVTLDGVLPTVDSISNELITARLPVGIQKGNHFLAVSRGNGPLQNYQIKLANPVHQDCTLRPDEDLRGANLHDCDLSGTNLSEAILTNANLNSADLTDAILSGVNLDSASLRFVILTAADMIGVRLYRADLSEANLIVADLTTANLSEAILIRAHLDGANLERANLNKTDLTDAILSGV